MTEFGPFQNSDPPKLVDLWHACRLGRGAASDFSYNALESLLFAQAYFDPAGLIVARHGGEAVGLAHAGFGYDPQQKRFTRETGVICAVMVRPDSRRQGVGRELVRRAEAYLADAGARKMLAGPAEPNDPFYVGLYGGSRPSGFLESDPDAAPFFQALGFETFKRHRVLQRNIATQSDPINFRLVTIRRKMQTVIMDHPEPMSWWWLTRFGRLDSVHFQLAPKTGGDAVASATVVGLDLYIAKWGERAVGLTDVVVPREKRRQGYGQALVLEICRRLKQEAVTLVETHAPEDDASATALFESAGFHQVDTGVVYRKKPGS